MYYPTITQAPAFYTLTILNAAVVRGKLDLELDEDEPLVKFMLGCRPKILTIVSRGWPALQAYRFLQHFMNNNVFDEKLLVNLKHYDSPPAFRLIDLKPVMQMNFSST